MGHKKQFISINRNGVILKLEVRDITYKVLHRGSYRVNNKKDLYYMLSIIEKFSPYTINQIINSKDSWI